MSIHIPELESKHVCNGWTEETSLTVQATQSNSTVLD